MVHQLRVFIHALILFSFVCEASSGGHDLSAAETEPFNLQEFVNTQIQTGSTRVVVPPGNYRVTPVSGRHLQLKNLTDVEIVADGVEMVCTETVQAVRLDGCKGVRLTGLTIDYDPLPFTQGSITAVAQDKSWVEFQIIDGYPVNTLVQRIEIFDPKTMELRREFSGWAEQFQDLGNGRYKLEKNHGYQYRDGVDMERKGDIFVTNNAYPGHAQGHAIELNNCRDVTIEGITIYASPLFGFCENRCEATTYRNCKINRRAAKDDPIKRGFPRMRSLNADAFHSGEATKGPSIINCVAKYHGDDCVNIHGVYHLITAVEGTRLRVASVDHMAIEPGDRVEFLPYSGPRPDDAIAVSIEPDSVMTDKEKDFINTLAIRPEIKAKVIENKAKLYSITLDRSVSALKGSVVCSAHRVGDGFLVKGCDFGHNRSRGILIKASQGEVSGNRITNGWMSAVLVAPEFWWLEAGASNHVLINDNTIVGCRRPAIEILAYGGDGKVLPSGAHNDIRILRNKFTKSTWPNIHVTSTSELVIDGNQLSDVNPDFACPPKVVRWDWHHARPSLMVIDQSTRIDAAPSK